MKSGSGSRKAGKRVEAVADASDAAVSIRKSTQDDVETILPCAGQGGAFGHPLVVCRHVAFCGGSPAVVPASAERRRDCLSLSTQYPSAVWRLRPSDRIV